MNYRFADGSDKIAAFERGMSDEDVHAAFETSGTTAYIVDEQFLVAYCVIGYKLFVVAKIRLYGGPAGWDVVDTFVMQEAHTFKCAVIKDKSA